MVSILFLIGHGLEQSDIIDHMLNIEKCPSKPQYGMASGQCESVVVSWPFASHFSNQIKFCRILPLS